MIAIALLATVLTVTGAPPGPVPPEETTIAETFFTTKVAEVAGETPTQVACTSEAGVDDSGQATVISRCYGLTGGGLLWSGQITHVSDHVDVILFPYSIDTSVESFVEDGIPAPPLVIAGAAVTPPPTTVGSTVAPATTATLPATTTTAAATEHDFAVAFTTAGQEDLADGAETAALAVEAYNAGDMAAAAQWAALTHDAYGDLVVLAKNTPGRRTPLGSTVVDAMGGCEGGWRAATFMFTDDNEAEVPDVPAIAARCAGSLDEADDALDVVLS